MATTVAIILLIAVPIGLTLAVLWLPRWFSMSLARHALWRMRDRLADDMLRGALPKDHPAVRELLGFVDWFTRESKQLTLMRMYLWSRAWRSFSKQDIRAHVSSARPALTGLTKAERKLLDDYREHARYLMLGTTLFGTWLGIATVLRYMPPALLEAHRRVRARARAATEQPKATEFVEREALVTIRVATTRAATDSWFGARASELIKREECELAGVA